MSSNEPGTNGKTEGTLVPGEASPRSTAVAPAAKPRLPLPLLAVMVLVLIAVAVMVLLPLWQQWQQTNAPSPSPVVSHTPAAQPLANEPTNQRHNAEVETEAANTQAQSYAITPPVMHSDPTPPADAPAATQETPPSPEEKADVPESAAVALAEPAHVPEPAADTVPQAEHDAQMAALQNRLSEAERSTTALTQTIDTLRQAEQDARHTLLKTRLDWILAPETRLLRIAAIWQSLADDATLTAAQRAEAASMAKLATQQADTVQAWIEQLQSVLPQLQTTMPQPSLIPNDQWWQRWLNSQFSLRPAPDDSERKRIALSGLIDTLTRQLKLEQWPDATAWGTLVEQLNNAGLATGLPANLGSFMTQTDRLRAVAQQWQEVQP